MRKYLNGGYYTLDLEDGTTNYQELLQSIKNGKAIMIKLYDNVYFADSVAVDEDTESIILTKGGKTITVDIYGDVNDEGEIQPSAGETHLYVLTLYYSDTNFVVYTPDKGLFEINEEYDIVNSDGEYQLSDELTTSILSIFDKIKVGAYEGIPLVCVNDSPNFYMNNSDKYRIKIYDASETYILSVDLTTKIVSANNNEDWIIKFTQII